MDKLERVGQQRRGGTSKKMIVTRISPPLKTRVVLIFSVEQSTFRHYQVRIIGCCIRMGYKCTGAVECFSR